jgi:hypothetical protein
MDPACWTRLENESAELEKLVTASSDDGGVAGVEVVLTGGMEGDMEKLLICISRTFDIGPILFFIRRFLPSSGRLIRLKGIKRY